MERLLHVLPLAGRRTDDDVHATAVQVGGWTATTVYIWDGYRRNSARTLSHDDTVAASPSKDMDSASVSVLVPVRAVGRVPGADPAVPRAVPGPVHDDQQPADADHGARAAQQGSVSVRF